MIDFKKLYENFEGDIKCPSDCNLCGSANIVENIILLPGEKDYLEAHNYPCSFKKISYSGIWSIPQNCVECKGCHPEYKEKFRPIRSIDCRTFPFVVFTDGDGAFDLMLSTNCPIANNLPQKFIDDVKAIWIYLLQFPLVRDDIKTLCKMENLNNNLRWKYYSAIAFY